MGDRVTILLPRAEAKASASRLAPRPASLAGKRVGFIDNELWRSMHILVDELAQVFTQEYGVTGTETIFVHPGTGLLPKEYIDELAALGQRVDVVVSGLGN
jgi:hypothetical protein